MTKAILALEDGVYFEGESFGATGTAFGEIVFNTGLGGYQEILTDPSYKGQMVCMTYPQIGNYGINFEDGESQKPWVEGFIVKEASPIVSNYRSKLSLAEYLAQNNILGIQGIDTRKLVKHLRTVGSKKGVISTVELDPKKLVKAAKESREIVGVDLVREVTCLNEHFYDETIAAEFAWGGGRKKKYKVVAIDSGAKLNIFRKLNQHGFNLHVVPASAKAEEILSYKPDGLFLSNGPGDPSAVKYLVETVRTLIGKLPIFGICFGHQIIGLALGGKTLKLKFGHHGNNHPVMDLTTGKIEITSQNHNFIVDLESLSGEVEATHINLNDKTLEGFQHKKHPVFSVQYHPENAPGPHDSDYLFTRFYELIEASKQNA